jgi:hypothetical protein
MLHPQDERYVHLVGRHCIVPLSGGRCANMPFLLQRSLGSQLPEGYRADSQGQGSSCWQETACDATLVIERRPLSCAGGSPSLRTSMWTESLAPGP